MLTSFRNYHEDGCLNNKKFEQIKYRDSCLFLSLLLIILQRYYFKKKNFILAIINTIFTINSSGNFKIGYENLLLASKWLSSERDQLKGTINGMNAIKMLNSAPSVVFDKLPQSSTILLQIDASTNRKKQQKKFILKNWSLCLCEVVKLSLRPIT